jgi:hypothetical protein
MPFKSEAQRRKFYSMANRGEISDTTVKRWEKHTKNKNLPEKVGNGEKKAALCRMLQVADKLLEKCARRNLSPNHHAIENVKTAFSIGGGAEQLGGFVGKSLGLKSTGGYLTRQGAKKSLTAAGEISKKTRKSKLAVILKDELSNRKRMLGYGTAGVAGTGAGLLGYALGSSDLLNSNSGYGDNS